MKSNSKYPSIIESMRKALNLLKKGQLAIFWKQMVTRLNSETVSIGLRRDVEAPFEAPDARIDLSIRQLKDDDIAPLLEDGKLMETSPHVAYNQLSLLKADLNQCYVATTSDDTPCYMQWLVGPPNGEDYYFDGVFPQLKESEALLEGAFVPPSFRGNRIMPAAMARIASRAKNKNVRWVITFVEINNIPSLKGCKRAGFSPYVLRKDRWFFFNRSVTYEKIPEEMMQRYEKVTT